MALDLSLSLGAILADAPATMSFIFCDFTQDSPRCPMGVLRATVTVLWENKTSPSSAPNFQKQNEWQLCLLPPSLSLSAFGQEQKNSA